LSLLFSLSLLNFSEVSPNSNPSNANNELQSTITVAYVKEEKKEMSKQNQKQKMHKTKQNT